MLKLKDECNRIKNLLEVLEIDHRKFKKEN